MTAFIIGNMTLTLAVLFWFGGLGDDTFAHRCRIMWKLLAIVACVCFIIWAITY